MTPIVDADGWALDRATPDDIEELMRWFPDDEAVRATTAALLERSGARVLLACDGQQAIELFDRRCDEIDAVLLDYSMPNANGEEAFDAVRSRRPETIPMAIPSPSTGRSATARCRWRPSRISIRHRWSWSSRAAPAHAPWSSR